MLLKRQQKQKLEEDQLDDDLKCASIDMFAMSSSVNMGSIDDSRSAHTPVTEEPSSQLFPPSPENPSGELIRNADFLEGRIETPRVNIDMTLYRQWSRDLGDTVHHMSDIATMPSTVLGESGMESGSSGAGQVFKVFMTDNEYKKLITALLKESKSVKYPFPDELFTPEVWNFIDFGTDYIKPCKKFEGVCRNFVQLSAKKIIAYHEKLRDAEGEGDSAAKSDIADGDAFISGQYQSNEGNGEEKENEDKYNEDEDNSEEEEEEKTEEQREKERIFQEKLKKIAALKKLKEEGIEDIDDEFLRIDNLIRECKERTRIKRLEKMVEVEESSSADGSNMMNRQSSFNTVKSNSNAESHVSRNDAVMKQDKQTETKWRMVDIIFDPFLGDSLEEPGLFLCAFECYYGYGLSLLERAQIITSDIRKIESCYFDDCPMGNMNDEGMLW